MLLVTFTNLTNWTIMILRNGKKNYHLTTFKQNNIFSKFKTARFSIYNRLLQAIRTRGMDTHKHYPATQKWFTFSRNINSSKVQSTVNGWTFSLSFLFWYYMKKKNKILLPYTICWTNTSEIKTSLYRELSTTQPSKSFKLLQVVIRPSITST